MGEGVVRGISAVQVVSVWFYHLPYGTRMPLWQSGNNGVFCFVWKLRNSEKYVEIRFETE